MRKIISSINVTPDGFCDHTHVIPDEELHNNANELLRNCGLVLFGRVTYQLFANSWPDFIKNKTGPDYMNEFARLINDIDKIVFSKTLKTASWKNTKLLHEIDRDEILKLKEQEGKNILLAGPGLISEFSKLGLVDEYYFVVHPIIAGGGKRFFETVKLDDAINLTLISTKTFESGAIQLGYAVK